MSAGAVLFYVFAGMTILASLGMVLNIRNTVASAMSLVVAMISLGAIYVLLDAYLVAAIQIMVYAGAIVVLFLFVVMLLNLRTDVFPVARSRLPKLLGIAASGWGLFAFLKLLHGTLPAVSPAPGGIWRLPRTRQGALYPLRAALRSDLIPAARCDCRCGDPGQTEDRLMLVPLEHVIALSAVIFGIGVVGAVTPPECDRDLDVHRAHAERRESRFRGLLAGVGESDRAGFRLDGDYGGCRRGRRRPWHRALAFPQPRLRRRRGSESAQMVDAAAGVTETSLLRWIPFLPLGAAAIHGVLLGLVRRPLSRRGTIFLSCGAVLASFLISLFAFAELLGPEGPRVRVDNLYTWIGAGKFSAEASFLLGSDLGGDDPRGHLRGFPDPRLLDRLHGRRSSGRHGVPALLLLPEPLHLLHADAGSRRQPLGDVPGLGGGGPVLVPVDRFLV